MSRNGLAHKCVRVALPKYGKRFGQHAVTHTDPQSPRPQIFGKVYLTPKPVKVKLYFGVSFLLHFKEGFSTEI